MRFPNALHDLHEIIVPIVFGLQRSWVKRKEEANSQHLSDLHQQIWEAPSAYHSCTKKMYGKFGVSLKEKMYVHFFDITWHITIWEGPIWKPISVPDILICCTCFTWFLHIAGVAVSHEWFQGIWWQNVVETRHLLRLMHAATSVLHSSQLKRGRRGRGSP